MTSDTQAFYRLAMKQAKAIPACKTGHSKRRAINAFLETHKAALRADGIRWEAR